MKLAVTGACGFVGSTLIRAWKELGAPHEFIGFDNLARAGSEGNRSALQQLGVKLVVGDLRARSDVERLGPVDAVIDAAALPSVLAGVDGASSSRQVVEHNLIGTINLLEHCAAYRAAFVLLSTSRVYSIPPLAALPLAKRGQRFDLDASAPLPPHISTAGVTESFSTAAPISLYGASKVASETLALEYGDAFRFPVWINRCGLMAGPGQFGHPAQGIVSYWVHAWRAGRPLRYIGFGGEGRQLRDVMDPQDLLPLLDQQLPYRGPTVPRIVNASGGNDHTLSLAELSAWCAGRFGPHPMPIERSTEDRLFDLPWIVLDSSLAQRVWNWRPATPLASLLSRIADFADTHPDWLSRSSYN